MKRESEFRCGAIEKKSKVSQYSPPHPTNQPLVASKQSSLLAACAHRLRPGTCCPALRSLYAGYVDRYLEVRAQYGNSFPRQVGPGGFGRQLFPSF